MFSASVYFGIHYTKEVKRGELLDSKYYARYVTQMYETWYVGVTTQV